MTRQNGSNLGSTHTFGTGGTALCTASTLGSPSTYGTAGTVGKDEAHLVQPVHWVQQVQLTLGTVGMLGTTGLLV